MTSQTQNSLTVEMTERCINSVIIDASFLWEKMTVLLERDFCH